MDDPASQPRVPRRRFLKASAAAGGALLVVPAGAPRAGAGEDAPPQGAPAGEAATLGLPDLRPARWIWYPSGRCLPSTFVLFRRELDLEAEPVSARGWISADSRYLLRVGGRRVQWGPAPCDPRWLEADPVDLLPHLRKGRNVLAATVHFYGHGDGTMPIGKPGFLFRLEVELADGSRKLVASDASWRAHYARAWRPGQYKRWYLRSLQEELDLRAYPHGWDRPDYPPAGAGAESGWLPAMEIPCAADKPPLTSGYPDYLLDSGGDPSTCELRPRTIPLLDETMVPVARLAESMWVRWLRPAEEYFECVTPGAFEADREACASEEGPGSWKLALDGRRTAALTFELEEQTVGWPRLVVDAPAGTIVELLVQEAHRPGGPPLLNTHFHAWSRFTCAEGTNEVEPFDFESLRWLQVLVRGAKGTVWIRDVSVRRRRFPWPNEPRVSTSEPALDRLVSATINTLHNCAQETLVDGMGRERQQYSGDCGHQLHAIWLGFGETRLPARYLRTFSQGITLDGYFLDCWPAWDRLARLMERQLRLTSWGPLLDHGVGFHFDCLHHWMHTGDLEPLREPYPRLVRFARYLEGIRREDGLLAVDDLGIPSVWMDHTAYPDRKHRHCAFNLYAAAMLEHALPVLARAFGDGEAARRAERFGSELRAASVRTYWSPEEGAFVINRPWLAAEGSPRFCDRSLATSVLFDQCPGGVVEPSLRLLAACPPSMGFSYPANAGWRLWALAKGGLAEPILKDLRERWATMDSVILNNTLQEDWTAHPDSGSQWSHCAVAPLYILQTGIAGIWPLEPGFARCRVRPQLGDLGRLELVARTVRGPIAFRGEGTKGARRVTVGLPPGCEGELVAPATETLPLDRLDGAPGPGLGRWRLPAGRESTVELRHA